MDNYSLFPISGKPVATHKDVGDFLKKLLGGSMHNSLADIKEGSFSVNYIFKSELQSAKP